VTQPGEPNAPYLQPREDWTLVIKPLRGWAPLDLAALWRYRELLYFLTWRDIKVRYKQTALGGAWALLQPLLTMVIFTVVFGHFARMPSEGVPYPIFSYTGLLPWTFFAYAITQSGNSLVANANLISKIYFPRLVVPIAASLGGLVDLGIAFSFLLAMMVYYRVTPTAAMLALPVFVLLALAAALAIGIWLSSLNVKYRDVRYAIPFLTQVWLYATPVAYPASLIHGKLRLVFALNPMSAVVEGFRWSMLGARGLDVPSMLISSSMTVLCLVAGLFYFRQTERYFADIV
jgi:lipopolysaccharide transport system permease protein